MICEQPTDHMPSLNPRLEGQCAKCGKPIPQLEVEVETRPRDIAAERHLGQLAASAVGLTRPGPDGRAIGDTLGLDDFADHRALPGGVRLTLDSEQECLEELADARNYLVWGLVPLSERFEAGDADAAEMYSRRLRALSYVVKAWAALVYEGP